MDWSTVYGDSNCGFRLHNGYGVVLLPKARTCLEQLLPLDYSVVLEILWWLVKHVSVPQMDGLMAECLQIW